MNSKDILARLIEFPTVSRNSNIALMRYISEYLAESGVASELLPTSDGTKASLHAVIGPAGHGGVLLSGHTDVVPTDGQVWSTDPFRLTRVGNRLLGRGTTDMKGFIASVLAAVPSMVQAALSRPIHLVFSYDEEVGCIGVRPMLDLLRERRVAPQLVIVGEPTEMQVAVSHKGKMAATCTCSGVPAHSALAPHGLNAIHMAVDMITKIRELQVHLATNGRQDSQFAVPYSTLHIGTIVGGTALNIVPSSCDFQFEIRNLPSDEAEVVMAAVRSASGSLLAFYRQRFPAADIDISIDNAYPALSPAADDGVALACRLVHSMQTTKVAFGTEAGLFQRALGVPVVVCGPGSMEQGHKADEFIEIDQVSQCDAFLERVITELG